MSHHPFSSRLKPLAAVIMIALGCGVAFADQHPEHNEAHDDENTLVGRAVLPAATFAPGPSSGSRLGASQINGQTLPFIDKQPVQGFSAVLDNHDGSFLAMSDNGYGSMENSADYELRVYTLRPEFETKKGGSGQIEAESFIQLSDPDKHIPFAITNYFTDQRVLTGADFDIESMQRAADGSLWFGDEFGPFLLHTDADGKLLEAPIALPDVDNAGQIRSPQNPLNEEASAVRIMNAVSTHARLHGNTRAPVFSPYHVMLMDNNPAVKHYARDDNPQPGLMPAASAIFDIQSIQKAGYPVVTWTVDDKARMLELMRLGVNGIISDRPDILLEAVREFDADGDGIGGDYLDADGLIDITRFDAQGHRGARNLHPENTLPAMEAALDNLMSTLETDTGVSADHTLMLSHDPYIQAGKCRRADGSDYTVANEILIKDMNAQDIQNSFICDKVFRGPSQKNDPALSPVAAAFAAERGLIDPYVMPTAQQLFDFVTFYSAYYRSTGLNQPDAQARAKNAEQVHFNIETKINPRSDKDARGVVYKERSFAVNVMADTLASLIQSNGLSARADIQSFDFRTLLRVQEHFPAIRTVYLFGDFPIYNSPDSDDGTNMQDENGANTPWMAGLYWPYRVSALSHPFRAQRSGGFEGMALSADGTKLLALMEKPLINAPADQLLIHEFDLAAKRYTGTRYTYTLDARGKAIGDFVMFSDKKGAVIERDNTQGDLNGFKTVYQIELQGAGQAVTKKQLIDLLHIADPHGLSGESVTGDVGLGHSFAMPFVTIEDIVILDKHRIGIMNDNNYPFSIGRHLGTERPDDTEFVIIKVEESLQGETRTLKDKDD